MESPNRICPLVQLRSGQIYLSISPKSKLFWHSVCGCAPNVTQGSSMRRLLTVLRLLRVALREREMPDFDARICTDDFCHGLWEGGRPLPWFTMVSCATAPSIPAVQWNTYMRRDPDFASWDSHLSRLSLARRNRSLQWKVPRPEEPTSPTGGGVHERRPRRRRS